MNIHPHAREFKPGFKENKKVTQLNLFFDFFRKKDFKLTLDGSVMCYIMLRMRKNG